MGVARVPGKQLGVTQSNVLTNVACDSSVFVGALVRMDAATGKLYNAIATSKVNANVIGIVSDKPTSTTATVRLPNCVTDSMFTGLTMEKPYFLSATDAGEITETPVTGAGNILLYVGTPYTTSKLMFRLGEPIVRS